METKEIGSDIYTEMYASSKLDSEAKVKLVLKQLGCRNGWKSVYAFDKQNA